MTPLYLVVWILLFIGLAMILRRPLRVLLLFLAFAAIGFVAIMVLGFMPDYSRGVRSGVIQKYSVRGILFKSGEITMVLPVEGMMMDADSGNIFMVSCLFHKTNDDCKEIEEAVASRKRIVIDYHQWLVKPAIQDSDYTVTKAHIWDEQKDNPTAPTPTDKKLPVAPPAPAGKAPADKKNP